MSSQVAETLLQHYIKWRQWLWPLLRLCISNRIHNYFGAGSYQELLDMGPDNCFRAETWDCCWQIMLPSGCSLYSHVQCWGSYMFTTPSGSTQILYLLLPVCARSSIYYFTRSSFQPPPHTHLRLLLPLLAQPEGWGPCVRVCPLSRDHCLRLGTWQCYCKVLPGKSLRPLAGAVGQHPSAS